jgi:hypothetical protein
MADDDEEDRFPVKEAFEASAANGEHCRRWNHFGDNLGEGCK